MIDAPASDDRMTTLCIGVLQRLDATLTIPQALIVAHDYQTVRHINDTLSRLGQYMEFSSRLLTSSSISADEKRGILEDPPSIIIVTVEAFMAFMQDKVVDCCHLTMLCVEDASKSFPAMLHDATPESDTSIIGSWLTTDPQRVILVPEKSEGFKQVMHRDFPYMLDIVVSRDDAEDNDDTADSDDFHFI